MAVCFASPLPLPSTVQQPQLRSALCPGFAVSCLHFWVAERRFDLGRRGGEMLRSLPQIIHHSTRFASSLSRERWSMLADAGAGAGGGVKLGAGRRMGNGVKGRWAEQKSWFPAGRRRGGWLFLKEVTYGNRNEEIGKERFEEVLEQVERQDIKVNIHTYAVLLRYCRNTMSLADGKRVHGHIFKSGFHRDRFLGNLLIEMYAKCGVVEDARKVFDEIAQRNVFSWSIMIAAYARNGHGREALELFRNMHTEGVSPNNITFVSILGACTSLGALEEGKIIHANIIASGFESNVAVATALVNMYGKCGHLEDASGVFDRMQKPNVISWTALIVAYSQRGQCKKALELFRQMQQEGVKPDCFTFVSVLGACAPSALAEGKLIHANIIDSGFESNVVVENALVDMYGKCGTLQDAKGVFDKMHCRDVISWTAFIAAHCQKGHGNDALELFRQMQQGTVQPNSITFVNIIGACASLLALTEGKVIHSSIVAGGYDSDTVVGTALIDMYGKCGHPKDAKSVFDKLNVRDVASWNALIAAYGQNGHSREALELFQQMQQEGMSMDTITLINVLDACDSVAAGKVIHASIAFGGYVSDAVGTALMSMYGKCGSPEDARSVFDKMHRWNVDSWTAMIAAYCQNGHDTEALELFQQLQQEGLTADGITFASVLSACATLAALTEGRLIHANVIASGFETDAVVENALINMYGKCGNLDGARRVFDDMHSHDVASWTALISAYGENGYTKEALELFWQMQQEGVKPDHTTFAIILSVCSLAGLVDEGRHYFVSMSIDHGIIPMAEHYRCMIDLFGQSGQLDQAKDLVNSMPLQPDAML